MSSPTAIDPVAMYLHLEDDGRASPVGPEFYGKLPGRIMGQLHMEAGTATDWEMHPHGEDILYIRSGAARVVLEEAGDERIVELTTDRPLCIVPRGTWHHELYDAPTDLVFITMSEGTLYR